MLFRRRRSPTPEPAPPPAFRVPTGERVYAIGDIHGRDDLFAQLLATIAADGAAREPARTHLILLGDLIDRGPDSAAVVARARALVEAGQARWLKGNHEEMLLRAAKGHVSSLRTLLAHGGRRTLVSYGITHSELNEGSFFAVTERIAARLPAADLAFLARGENMIRIGDYAFVHAGIRPGVPLAEQEERDLRWIRSPFIEDAGPHPACIVHGHTVTESPDEQNYRIGIDTGAFASGRLTAIGLEGAARWFLTTDGAPDADWNSA